MKEDSIYLITVMSHTFFPRHMRCWGWYPNITDAQKALDNDTFSMSEGLYDYAVIEKVNCGIPAIGEVVEWRQYKNGKWSLLEKEPMRFEGTVNFGIG